VIYARRVCITDAVLEKEQQELFNNQHRICITIQ
jgi:hypothetical protein